MRARPKVFSVAVEVTAHCQQKCDYCYNAWRDDNGAAMDHADIDRLSARVDKLLAAWEVDHVTVTGGEPFARKDVFRLLDAIKARGAGIQIISNGGVITDTIAERLAPYRVSYVQVTLNGPDAALHEAHVGPGHFAPTLEGVRTLRRHGVTVGGCTVVTRKNAARIAETLDLWRSLGVEQIALSRFSPAGYAARYAAELLPSRGDLLTAFRQAMPHAKRGMRLYCTMPVPPCVVEVEELEGIQFGTCPIGTSMQEIALGPDGRIRNCTLAKGTVGGDRDVLDPDVDPVALLDAPERARYRERLPAFCEGCLHANTCAGGCGAASEWVLGDARAFPDPLVWQHVDDAFGERLAEGRGSARPAGKRRLEVVA
jgi:radical SAM protein with 4Fe4S-binding SPASM domain